MSTDDSDLDSDFKLIVGSFPDGVVQINHDGDIVYCNRMLAKIFGYEWSELQGQKIEILIPDDLKKDHVKYRQDFYRAPFPRKLGSDGKFRGQTKSGELIPVDVSIAPVGSRGAFALVRDVTHEKNLQEELLSSLDRFLRATDGAGAGLVDVEIRGEDLEDDSNSTTYFSSKYRRLLGYNEDEFPDRLSSYFDIVHPEDKKRVQDVFLKHVSEGKAFDTELRLLHKSGKYRWFRTTGRAIVDKTTKNVVFTGWIEDIEDKKQMMRELDISRQMATIGMLAAGVAHEINNPLSFILSNTELLMRQFMNNDWGIEQSEKDKLVKRLKTSLMGLNRIKDIVKAIKTFSRVDSEEIEQVNIREASDAAVTLAGKEIAEVARIEVFGESGLRLLGNRGKLTQVLLNLIVNSGQAMDRSRRSENFVKISSSEFGDWVRICVEDNGSGMDEDTLSKAFDPFFTTKPRGIGTGMGLTLCHSLVTGMGGKINVESHLGKGTTFRLELPKSEGQGVCEEEQLEELPDFVVETSLKILVVDDEELIGEVVSEVLDEYDVDVVMSAKDGLVQLEKNSYDIIMCDIMMDEMNGIEFFAEVTRENPGYFVRFMFLTGGTFTADARSFVERQSQTNVVLEKPFEANDLFDGVYKTLESIKKAKARG